MFRFDTLRARSRERETIFLIEKMGRVLARFVLCLLSPPWQLSSAASIYSHNQIYPPNMEISRASLAVSLRLFFATNLFISFFQSSANSVKTFLKSRPGSLRLLTVFVCLSPPRPFYFLHPMGSSGEIEKRDISREIKRFREE